jgi:hypothetical protein
MADDHRSVATVLRELGDLALLKGRAAARRRDALRAFREERLLQVAEWLVQNERHGHGGRELTQHEYRALGRRQDKLADALYLTAREKGAPP